MKEELPSDKPDLTTNHTIPIELAQSTLDALTAQIAILNQEGIIVGVNRSWIRFHQENGYTHKNGGVGINYLSARTLFDKTPSPDAVNFSTGLEAVLNAKINLFEQEYLCDTAQGQVWFNARATLFPNNGKQYVVVTHEEISSCKQAAAEVIAAKTQLQYIIDHTHDTIFQIDLEGNYTYVNSSAQTLTGYTTDELLVMNMEELTAPEFKGILNDRLKNKISSDLKDGILSFEMIRKDEQRIWAELSTSPILNEKGELTGIQGVARDITERKRMRDALEKRIIALTQPMDDSAEIEFDVLFDLKEIQRIQDEFSAATGVASVIVAPDGSHITKASNATNLCMNIIRGTEKGLTNCVRSDAFLVNKVTPEKPFIQPCLSCGLLDAGTSIHVGGKHIATWLIGQVRNDAQTDESMRTYAKKIGANEDEFMKAFAEVPKMSFAKFEQICATLLTLSNQLSSSAYQNIQQARFIAAEKKAKNELRESKEYLEKIWTAINVGILLIDAETNKVLRANPALLRITGQKEDDLLDKPCCSVFCPTNDNKHQAESLGQTIGQSELKLSHADGHLIDIEKTVTSIILNGKKVYLEAIIDITDRKEAEAELRRLSTAIEQSPEAIVITDLSGCIQYVNPAFEKITGYSYAEALGNNPRMLKSGKHSLSFYIELWETLLSGKTWKGTLINRHKNGSLYTEEASISPVMDAEGHITNFVAVKRDTTVELLHEEELRKVQKMDAVGQLAGGIAHDFNNILQGIQGFSELLESTLKEGSQEKSNATEIKKATKRASELTRQLLTFSRKQPTLFEEVDLNSVVTDTEMLIDMLMKDQHEILIELDPDLLMMISDRGQLTQVIMNLSVNARDAMPNEGCLTIKTENEELDAEDALRINGARPGKHVVLSVTDTGQGMTSETQERLFEPFFTTKEVGNGTGLGLSVVYGVVKQQRGWINVYSKIGKGTCIKVYFPAKPEHHDQKKPAHTGNPQDVKILVIEDDHEVASMITEILFEKGYFVSIAENAEEGLRLFEDSKMQYDMLMSDIELPGMRGDELAEYIRRSHPEFPTLLFSGYSDHKHRWSQIEKEGQLFMSKPFTTKRLLDSVATLLKT